MTANDVGKQIEEISKDLEGKHDDLTRMINRRKELERKHTQNEAARQAFIARINLECKDIINEINDLNVKLWGLKEIQTGAKTNEKSR